MGAFVVYRLRLSPMNLTLTIALPVSGAQAFAALADSALFDYIKPKFPPTKVLVYDGIAAGQPIAFEINVLGWRQTWRGHIAEHHEPPAADPQGERWFVDVGLQLPFPLKQWRHRHLVRSTGPSSCQIVEQIAFSCGVPALDFLLWPGLYFTFWPRIWLYKRWFLMQKSKG
jgi:hypothetical protein